MNLKLDRFIFDDLPFVQFNTSCRVHDFTEIQTFDCILEYINGYFLPSNFVFFHFFFDFFFLKLNSQLILALYSESTQSIERYDSIIGVPVVRQFRMPPRDCETPNHLLKFTNNNTCFDPYSESKQSTVSFLNYEYSESYRNSFHSILNLWYPYDGGFIWELKPNQTVPSNWLDDQTSAVSLEFTLYNGNINLFCIGRLLFETPPSGHVQISHTFHTSPFI